MQAPIVIPNGTGFDVRTNLNNAFQSIVGIFYGATAPNPCYPYQFWICTSTNPKTLNQVNITGVSSNVICNLTADGAIQFQMSNIAGVIPITSGGTGASTRQQALDALIGTQTAQYYLRSNGTNVSLSAIQASDIPLLNQNTTGTATNVSGIVAIEHGGTASNNRQTAINTLVGSQTSGYYLRSDGSNVSMSLINVDDLPTLPVTSIARGGTGATTVSQALFNLGALSIAGPNSLTGAINGTLTTLTSAATVNIGVANANYIIISGTTNISSFDSIQAGTRRFTRFSGTLTITYSSSMLIPGGKNLTVYSGDVLEWVSGGSGIWRCVNIEPWGRIPTAQTTLTSLPTISLDFSLGTVFSLSPTQDCTINALNGTPGQHASILITTSGTTSYSVIFGTAFKSTGTLTTGTVFGKVFAVSFVYDGTNWTETSRTIAM